jgi:hypothetical protein
MAGAGGERAVKSCMGGASIKDYAPGERVGQLWHVLYKPKSGSSMIANDG